MSGQTGSVRGDQSVFSPTFDLSPSLLKPLIEGSRELSEKVQRDANWADSNQLSTTWEGFVLKRTSRIVVPDDVELRRKNMSEYHDTYCAGHYGIGFFFLAVGCLFWWFFLFVFFFLFF